MGQAKIIGVIELVNPEQNYVLINCEHRLSIPVGTEIVSQGANGSRTRLTVSPERKGNYITADIKDGTPQVRDLVLYQVQPGDIPTSAPTTTTAQGLVVPLAPIMKADVIPPLDAPFQPMTQVPTSTIPTLPPQQAPSPAPPPVKVDLEESLADPSKLPPVIR